jgi:hypothetical protein
MSIYIVDLMMEIVLSKTCLLSEDHQGTLNSCIGLCFTQIVYNYEEQHDTILLP